MTSFNVQVVGTANVSQMHSAFGKLQSQVTALNAQLATMVNTANGVDPAGYQRMTKAAQANSQMFRNAAASTGMFEVQQIKVNRATEEYTRLLQKQKLSLRDMMKQRKVAHAAYKEQLAMQNMIVRQAAGGQAGGRSVLDVVYPKEVNAELNTLGNRLGWIREQAKSASTQMVNWGKNTQWAGRQLMVGFTMPIAAFGAATGALAYQMDKQLTRIQKVYDTTADATDTSVKGMIAVEKELMRVREDSLETARKAAGEYGVAMNETLEIQAELAATGLNGQRLQESTNEIMRIATLGEMEHADALNATIALQSVFNMNTRELTESFNYMNAVENATSLQLKDFAAAIPIAAAPVKQFGGDIYELGTLLTAMRENGIEATQGANAIKAAMQRLGRPSKQIREEFTAITGADITEIFEQSESLIEIFQRLNEVTRDLSRQDQTKVFAGLFGTYQVTRMSAMLKGMDKLAEGTGQVTAAYELAGSSAKEWADAADREMQRYQESVSGRFKIAVEEIKVELATMGAPFLEVASMIIENITKVLQWFNSLPDAAKKITGVILAFSALAGPAIMLTGLFANLIGNILKMGVSFTGLLTKFELLDKESRAAQLATELVSQGFMSETAAAQQLTREIQKLALAQAEANRQMMIGGTRATGGVVPATTAGTGATKGSWGQSGSGLIIPASTINNQNAVTSQLSSNLDTVNNKTTKIKKNWGGVVGNIGLAAGALATMGLAGDGAVNDIAQFVFMASLATPLVTGIGKGFKALGPHIADVGLSMRRMVISGLVSANIEAVKFGRNLKAAPVKALGRGLLGLATSTAGIGLAVGAVAYGAWKWYEWNKKNQEMLLKQKEAIITSGNIASRHLDIRIRKQKQLNAITPGTAPNRKGAGYSVDAVEEELKSNEAGNALLEAFGNADEVEREAIAAQKYAQILNAVGGNAEKARVFVNALYRSTEDVNAIDASNLALELSEELGNKITATETSKIWGKLLDTSVISSSSNLKQVKQQGTDLAKAWMDSIESAANDTEKTEMAGAMARSIGSSFDNLFNDLEPSVKEHLANLGVEGGAEFRTALAAWQQRGRGAMSDQEFANMFGIDLNQVADLGFSLVATQQQMGKDADYLLAAEAAMIDKLKERLGIDREILSIQQLMNTEEFKLATATRKTAEANHAAFVAQTRQTSQSRDDFNAVANENERILEDLNKWRAALGMAPVDEISHGFKTMKEIAAETGDVHDENNRKLSFMNQLLANARVLSREQAAELAKGAMSDYQQVLADGVAGNFETAMSEAMEAVEAEADRRTEALDRKHEREQRALEREAERSENRLENNQERRRDRVESRYDARIEKIEQTIDAEEKADEIRKRIFDAEMARLERLAEAANRNIDFNVALNAGELDEAAKIRNDMEAAATEWALSDAEGSGESRRDRRRDALEKRLDVVNEEKDARMDALDDIEEREKRMLDRSLERRERQLQDQQDAQKKALQQELKNTREAAEDEWQIRRDYLEKSLKDFTGYVALNAKDLQRHIRTWKEEHRGLSRYTEGQFNITAREINEAIRTNVENSRKKMENDNAWKISGNKIARQMINGAFGMTPQEFQRWLKSGKPPKNWKIPTLKDLQPAPGSNQGAVRASENEDWARQKFFHTGGSIGNDMGGRTGYARNSALHPNEVPIVAERGEYMVNKHAAKKNKAVLEAMNRGKNFDTNPGGGNGGIGMGFAGLMGAMMWAALKNTIGSTVVAQGMQRMSMNSLGTVGTAAAAQYGDVAFSAQQLAHAATIAEVGRGMGMSSRDIMIGIMTAITESMLSLPTQAQSDRDSAGLFQQRPSQGWGSVAQVMDPVYAATQFFKHLKEVGNRGSMSPWEAAQAVQRSAFSDGSNYQKYWDEAQEIFTAMTMAQVTQGRGGWHLPIAGRTVGNTHAPRAGSDIGVARGTNVRAVYDGTVIASKDIPGPLPTDRYRGDGPYGSYGRYVMMRHDLASGPHYSLYAHLMSRGVNVGQRVRGGTVLGKSGNTGNSSGPHLHFEIGPGLSANSAAYPGTFLANRGLPALREGAMTLSDGMAMLHRGETVLTADLTKQLHEGIARFANGGYNNYNLKVEVAGTNASAEEIARAAVRLIERREARKPQSRSGR